MTDRTLLDRQSELGNRRSAIRPAFTLIELLLAMFIFALGLVAVVSLFPVGSALQADAVDEAMTRRIKDNTEALLRARKIDVSSLSPSNTNVQRFPPAMLDDGDLACEWPHTVRCYPTFVDRDGDGDDDAHTVNANVDHRRRYYWVPLARKDGNQWQVFVFIVRSKNGASYSGAGTTANPDDPDYVPKVVRVGASGSGGSDQVSLSGGSDYFSPGDQVLSNDGIVYTVEDINGSTLTLTSELVNNISQLWYARADEPNRESPTRRIFAMGAEAVK